MPAKPCAIVLFVVVATAAGLVYLFSTDDRTREQNVCGEHNVAVTAHSAASSDPSAEALPSKFKQRPPSPLVTKTRTQALLETPIPGPVEFPEQTLAERVAAINQWLEQAGIPRDQLRVAVEARTAPRNLNLLERFAVEGETPSTVLKYTAGRTRLYYKVRPGLVELVTATNVDPPPDPPDGDDPFAQ